MSTSETCDYSLCVVWYVNVFSDYLVTECESDGYVSWLGISGE